MRIAAALLCLLTLFPAGAPAQPTVVPLDAVLQAMVKELDRSRQLRLASLDAPYFIQYGLEDVRSFSVSATLGALISSNKVHSRVPRIQVRVGSYRFDNTNYVYTGYFTRRGPRAAPLDDNVLVLRNFLWLVTDRAYKGALAEIARKRAALRNVQVRDQLPDFSRTEPVVMVLEPPTGTVDEALWTDRVRKLSAVFTAYPKITGSEVSFETVNSTSYLANSEGTLIRTPDTLTYLRIRATAQAPDGMRLHEAAVIQRLDIQEMPSALEMQRTARTVAKRLTALTEAPAGESYAGPVLFEGRASPQLFAQVLGNNLAIPRRPVPEPGRPNPFQASELEGRIGSRILPEWMDVVDDPTQKQWRGQPLFGQYLVDMEGVKPEPLPLVEHGILKAFLLTRQPVKGFSRSNGRARLPGRFGAMAAGFSNLFIGASKTVTAAALRKRLLDLCRQRNKPYGIVIRQLDFPSSASFGELHRLAVGMREHGGGGRLISPPILAYRLYPDGKEELVRGLRFRAIPVRTLRDITAASNQDHLFRFLGNTAPLSMMGAGGYVTGNTVVAPSVLIEDLELDATEEELPKLPVVPPPKLTVLE